MESNDVESSQKDCADGDVTSTPITAKILREVVEAMEQQRHNDLRRIYELELSVGRWTRMAEVWFQSEVERRLRGEGKGEQCGQAIEADPLARLKRKLR